MTGPGASRRIEPPCPFVAAGCGGCGWQHLDPADQRSRRAAAVAAALARAGVPEPVAVLPGPAMPTAGYRTTLHGLADGEGRFALRRRRSHDLVAVPACLVAHPRVAEVLAAGRFPPGAEVTVRAGARTGQRMVVVDGVPEAAVDGVEVPDDVRVVAGAALDAGRRAWLFEEVAGVRLRVSARSFFQAGPDAAEALVAAVGDALGGPGAAEGARLADLYGGVGLFAAVLGRGARVEAVDASPSAAADARVNLADLDARVSRDDVARWRARRMDLVVADPPRAGLGRGGVRTVAATRAGRLALVSCDAAALGRDTALLARVGYRWAGSTLVDAFPHTAHVEVVTRFVRATGPRPRIHDTSLLATESGDLRVSAPAGAGTLRGMRSLRPGARSMHGPSPPAGVNGRRASAPHHDPDDGALG